MSDTRDRHAPSGGYPAPEGRDAPLGPLGEPAPTVSFYAPGKGREIAVGIAVGVVCGGALWLAGWGIAVIVYRAFFS